MTLYVKSNTGNQWHWCKNCSKYPKNIGKTRRTRPAWDLCEECKAKQRNKNCKT